VYGIVTHDFKAEQSDELGAKAGEALVLMSRVGPGWFVAKPIGRLGGPGLIPVSFIQVRDVASDEPVTGPVPVVTFDCP
jgi:bud emergence protein 1